MTDQRLCVSWHACLQATSKDSALAVQEELCHLLAALPTDMLDPKQMHDSASGLGLLHVLLGPPQLGVTDGPWESSCNAIAELHADVQLAVWQVRSKAFSPTIVVVRGTCSTYDAAVKGIDLCNAFNICAQARSIPPDSCCWLSCSRVAVAAAVEIAGCVHACACIFVAC